ncbi:hypothetical protein [Sulfitobacter sp. 1A12779]|uniref:hypothetical protein n=1 Tax=Sulfitobacter sp. 1A12779 TaxID=3368599 RepID=UPI0037474B51
MPDTPIQTEGMAAYTYRRHARSRTALLLLPAIWLALAAAWLWLDASGWIIGVLGLFTLPALWEVFSNPASGLTLDQHSLSWFTGKRDAKIALAQVDRVRLDTRLDMSVRATVILRTGRKIKLPFEATPPHRALEAALQARGITTERHHFTLI